MAHSVLRFITISLLVACSDPADPPDGGTGGASGSAGSTSGGASGSGTGGQGGTAGGGLAGAGGSSGASGSGGSSGSAGSSSSGGVGGGVGTGGTSGLGCSELCAEGMTSCAGACVDLDIDEAQCGSCGTPCSGTCVAGACLSSFQSKIVTTTSAAKPIVDPTNIYWIQSSSGDILKAPKTGGPISVVAASQAEPYELAQDAGHVYWTAALGGAVMRIPKSGGTPQLVAAASLPRQLEVSALEVFWVEAASGVAAPWTIRRAPSVGGAPTTLVTHVGTWADLATDGIDLFVSSYEPYVGVVRYSKTGTNLGKFATAHSQTDSMAADATHLCVVERSGLGSSTAIVCHEKSTGAGTVVVASSGAHEQFEHLESDGPFVYYVRDSTWLEQEFHIERAPKCGGTPTKLQTSPMLEVPVTTGLTVDGDFVYWTTADGIYRAAK